MDSAKAELIGLLCAEGYYGSYNLRWIEFNKKRNKSYFRNGVKSWIGFTNKNDLLFKHFITLLNKIYNYKGAHAGKYQLRILKKGIIIDLLEYTNYGSMKWKVPDRIKKSNNKIKIAFIRGLYEGDGTKIYYDKYNYPRIGFHMVNYKGLLDIQKMLTKLNIKSTLSTHLEQPPRQRSTRLYMYGEHAHKFLKLITPKFK